MAQWHYYDENGEKIGPIRGRDLKQLVQQGTVTPKTLVEDENGYTAPAKNVRGLTFPETAQPTEPNIFAAAPSAAANPFTALPTDPNPFTAPMPEMGNPFTAPMPGENR